MDRETQLNLMRRLRTHLVAGTTDEGMSVAAQPVRCYTSQERFEREWTEVFEKFPLVIGESSAVVATGQYLAVRLRDAQVLVVRDERGKLRAYKNVCRHRGMPLVPLGTGSAKKCFACPYHNWVYGLDGKLEHVPYAGAYATIDFNTLGLVELPVAEHLGFVWAKLTPGPPLDLEAHLGRFGLELAHFLDGRSTVVNPVRETWSFNWKLWIETGLETHHVNFVHRESIGHLAHGNLSTVDAEGRNLRVLFAKRTVSKLNELPEEDWNLHKVANLFYFVFPNTMLLVERDRVTRITLVPTGVGQTEYDQSCRIKPGAQSPEHIARDSELVNRVFREDLGVARRIHEGLAAGVNQHLLFGKHEFALAHFHAALEAALAGLQTHNLPPEVAS